MREIDTGALDAVARSMGIGNPATAVAQVVFDDDNLQQSYDVGQLVRYRASRRPGVGDGWVQVQHELSQAGTGLATNTFDPVASMVSAGEQGVEPTDVFWIYGMGCFAAAGADCANIVNANLSYRLADPFNFLIGGAAVHSFLLWSAGGTPVPYLGAVTSAALRGDAELGIRLPFPLPPGGLVSASCQVAAADSATLTFTLVGRVLPAGVLPTPS